MKYLTAAKDILITVLVIFAIFSLLSFFTQRNPVTVEAIGDEICLRAADAFLRGSIELNRDGRIAKWRTNKNIVHWRFNCSKAGTYKVSLIHTKPSASQKVIFTFDDGSLEAETIPSAQQTELGEIELDEGVHNAAFYFPEILKKSKTPELISIILSRTN